MSRFTGLARLLAFSTLIGGLVCTWLAARPANAEEWWLVARLGIWPSLVEPLTLGALGAFFALGALARRLDRPTLLLPNPGPRVHKVAEPKTGAKIPAAEPGQGDGSGRRRRRPKIEARLAGRRPDVPAFVDEVLRLAVDSAASDIHLQPLELSTRISLRVGGELEEVATAPRELHPDLIRRLQVLAALPSYQGDAAQDGRMTLDTPRGNVDVRLSLVPTHHGTKAVLRLARLDPTLFELDRLGMPANMLDDLRRLLAEPQGVLVLTGPTGSGKTTTLYAALAHIHASRGETTNLATLEDPIEVDLPFLSQTPVRSFVTGTDGAHPEANTPEQGFARALRSVLRQDPDVLMIGEVRDRETAATAVQAGLSGHLILTTLHAESAAGVFPRLVDLGVEPFLAASALSACLAQRLARRLCPECRHPAPPSRETVERLTRSGIELEARTFQVAEGCRACDGGGHLGRRAIFELFRIDPQIRRAITERVAPDRLAEMARAAGLASPPLIEQAISLAAAGEISLDEASRVAA